MQLDIRPTPAPTLANLIIRNTAKGVQLSWDVVSDSTFASAEIWHNTVNDFATATKLDEITDCVFTDVDAPVGVLRYYWVRAKNTYSRTDGNMLTGSATPAAIQSGDLDGTIVANLAAGQAAADQTLNYRTTGAPSNAPTPTGITIAANPNGSRDITLSWGAYTQGAKPADFICLFYKEGTGTLTVSDAVLVFNVNTTSGSYHKFLGVDPAKTYTAGIAAARKTENGIEIGPIVQPTSSPNWVVSAGSVVISAVTISGGAIQGIGAGNGTAVANSSITLSASGTLNGAGGGSITALDYTKVSGSKPPADATRNILTASTSNPSGGSNGDIWWNSSTKVLWTKASGAWTPSGTTDASQITTGYLSASRIAAGTISAGMLNVASLSAITANLGTVTTGKLSGSAGIDITGDSTFRGTTYNDYTGYTAALNVLSGSENGQNGIVSKSQGNSYAVLGLNLVGGSGHGIGGTANGYGYGVVAQNTSGMGGAIDINGRMFVSNSTCVDNLNAQYFDSIASSAFVRGVNTNQGWVYPPDGNIAIQFDATMNGSYRTYAGGTANGTVFIGTVSDERLKTDIQPETLGLDFIEKLRPKSYRMKVDPTFVHHGVIAQDVGVHFPAPNLDVLYTEAPDGVKGVNYLALIGPLIKAVQELSATVKSLQQQLEVLK